MMRPFILNSRILATYLHVSCSRERAANLPLGVAFGFATTIPAWEGAWEPLPCLQAAPRQGAGVLPSARSAGLRWEVGLPPCSVPSRRARLGRLTWFKLLGFSSGREGKVEPRIRLCLDGAEPLGILSLCFSLCPSPAWVHMLPLSK